MSTQETVPNVGDLWVLKNTFYSDPADTSPADPTVVSLTITDPNGVIVDASAGVVRDTQGVYHFNWTPLVGGAHEIIWHGTGAVQVVEPETLIVRSGLDQALATTQYIQGLLGTTGQGNPDLVARLALTCSEHIMSHCNRRFLPSLGSPTTKRFRANPGARVISLAPWDFQSTQTVTVVIDAANSGRTLVLEDDFYIAPENSVWGVADRLMLQLPLIGGSLTMRIDVTATFGWSAIPAPVKDACAYWVRDLIREVSAYPQGQQDDAAAAAALDGVVPRVCRQLLFPFRHQVVV